MAEISAAKMGATETSTTKVGISEISPIEMGVRHCMLVSPMVPRLSPLPKNCKMDLIYHIINLICLIT